MLNSFGKFCRKLRIDRDELLKDMAARLEVTSSYLSAVENAKRKVPQEWKAKLIQLYNLDEEQQRELALSMQEAKKELKIDLSEYNNEDKRVLMALAREYQGMDPETKTTIKNILDSLKKGD